MKQEQTTLLDSVNGMRGNLEVNCRNKHVFYDICKVILPCGNSHGSVTWVGIDNRGNAVLQSDGFVKPYRFIALT